MAITATQTNPSASGCQFASGAYLDTAVAADATITIGFTPRYVRVENVTDRIAIEWFAGAMSASTDTCLKTAAAGTKTLETTNKGIVVTTGAFKISSNATLAVLVNSKQLAWVAYA
jgi:hypothetical protein